MHARELAAGMGVVGGEHGRCRAGLGTRKVSKQRKMREGLRKVHHWQTLIQKGFQAGAGNRIRTDDLLITNQLLYQLSYAGVALWQAVPDRRLRRGLPG